MRQAIRALGWATNIFWAILLFFTITSVYSAFQIRPRFGEPYTTASGGSLTASLPFYIDNGGFYDITNLNMTTLVKDRYGTPISESSTFVPIVPHGRNVSATHDMALNIEDMTSESLSHLLFNDSVLNIDIGLKIDYANVVPFKISTNFTMDWGAPLNNLTISGLTLYNATHVMMHVNFENNSFLSLNGVMRLELVNNAGHVVGSGTSNMNVPPKTSHEAGVLLSLSGSLASVRGAHLYFETSAFSYGPMVISLA